MTKSTLSALDINIPGAYEIYLDEDDTIQTRDITDKLSTLDVISALVDDQCKKLNLPDNGLLLERLGNVIEALSRQHPIDLQNALKTAGIDQSGVYAIQPLENSVKFLMYWGQYRDALEKMDGTVDSFQFRLQQTLVSFTRLKRQRIETVEAFRKYLGAILLIADSLGDDIPHREKNARLGGLISIINRAITTISNDYYQYSANFYRDFPDLFGSTHLVKPYLEKIRDLEKEVKRLKGEPEPADDIFDSDF